MGYEIRIGSVRDLGMSWGRAAENPKFLIQSGDHRKCKRQIYCGQPSGLKTWNSYSDVQAFSARGGTSLKKICNEAPSEIHINIDLRSGVKEEENARAGSD